MNRDFIGALLQLNAEKGVPKEVLIETLEQAIVDLAARPPEWHREQGRLARRAATERYTVEAFESRWREIVLGVVAAGRSAAGRPAGRR